MQTTTKRFGSHKHFYTRPSYKGSTLLGGEIVMRGRKTLSIVLVLVVAGASTLSLGALVSLNAVPGSLSLDASPYDKLSAGVLRALGEGQERISLLIATDGPPGNVQTIIESWGASVSFSYKYIEALAATVPAERVWDLAMQPLVSRIYLDVERSTAASTPTAADLDALVESPSEFSLDGVKTITLSEDQIGLLEPNTYYNYVAMGADAVWSTGNLGQESLAVIIDTGIWENHFMLRDSVVDGIDISPDVGTEFEGFDAVTNHWHGSHVAGILAGHGAILLKSGDPLLQAIKRYTNLPLQDAAIFGFPGYKIVPLLGMAPLTALYIIKVFPHTGAGVSESIIIAAIEHAIDLKVTKDFDVDVISMSLGGASLFDGRDLEDRTVDIASSVGITVVSAAGNDGPAPMTVASPGSADSGLTVAAAAHPVDTRVFWDWTFGVPGIGHSLFVSKTPQIYAFSSRGPTSDGRDKPDVAATGIFVLSAFPHPGSPNGLAFASGTSMATPAVSGAASLLNTFAESSVLAATPEDLKQAIKGGAVWLDGYGSADQGSGYLNAWNALNALMSDPSYGDVATPLDPMGHLEDITNTDIVGSGEFTATIENLEPGFAFTYVFVATADTDSITVSLTGVDVNTRNPLGLNSFEVYIQSAKRTTYAYYIDSANVWGDATFTVTDDTTSWSGAVTGVFLDPFTRRAPIEPGFVKVVIEDDWTSSGPVSGTITISVTESPAIAPDLELVGSVADGGVAQFRLKLSKGATGAIVELWWSNDWTAYPTADLDLIILADETFNFDGATLNSPERAVVSDLKKNSKLTLYVVGFTVFDASETFTLQVTFTS